MLNQLKTLGDIEEFIYIDNNVKELITCFAIFTQKNILEKLSNLKLKLSFSDQMISFEQALS
jgi:hypothetical protein